MFKEIIICVIIVVAIVFGDTVTHNYTKEAVSELSGGLISLREKIGQESAKQEADEIYKKWEKRHNSLAYYIEHDELEKLETEMVGVKSYIETKQYEEAINELDKSIFILKHIEDKYVFNLQNVF